MLPNKADPIGNIVIMCMGGSSCGDVRSMHTNFINLKEKGDKKPKKELQIVVGYLYTV